MVYSRCRREDAFGNYSLPPEKILCVPRTAESTLKKKVGSTSMPHKGPYPLFVYAELSGAFLLSGTVH